MPCADVGAVSFRGVTLPNCAEMTSREQMQAALAAANATWRAKQEAQRRPMSPDEMAQFEEAWRERTECAMRAKQAQKEKRKVKRPRDQNRPPALTKLWAKAMSLQAATDTRLTMGARVALQAIRSLTARSKRVSRNGLAVLLGVSPRTIQRHIHLLKYRGYIRTRLITNRDGWVIGQTIEITEKVLPPPIIDLAEPRPWLTGWLVA